MSETKHTPGPWEPFMATDFPTYYVGCRRKNDSTLIITDLRTLRNPITKRIDGKTTFTNACLIAAAPDLLAACENAASFIDGVQMTLAVNQLFGKNSIAHGDMFDALVLLKSAIAKAKGEK